MESKKSLPTLGNAHLLPKPERWMIIASVTLILGLFLFQPFREAVVGKTLIGWTWEACNSRNGFLHGRLVPFIFPCLLFVAYLRSKHLTLSPSYWGLISLSLGLFLFWAGFRATQPRISLLGVPFVLIGFTHYLAGGKIAKFSIFPAFFLYFAIPVPGLGTFLLGQLQVFLVGTTYEAGTLLGLDLTLENSIIVLSDGREVHLGHGWMGFGGAIGIRLLSMTLMTGAILSYLIRNSFWKRWILFLSVIPALIFYTVAKLVLILFLVENGREDWAMDLYRDLASVFVFAFTITTILLISRLLNRQKVSRRKNLPA